MAYDTIILERRGPVAFIRFNRPDKLNAMNSRMKDEIIAALRDLETDDAARVAVFTGSGDKAFVAGAGIHEFKDRTPPEQWGLFQPPFPYASRGGGWKPGNAMVTGDCR